MQINEKTAVIEAILFASGDPVELDRIAEAADVEKDTVVKLINLLKDRYEETGSALEILKLGDSYQIATSEKYSDYIKSALETKKKTPLSPAAMEVLTIVAYNQPVTRGFIEQVRGVDSSGIVTSLVEKNLLVEAGRIDVPGKPIAYRTTDNFLRCFKMNSIHDLPPIPNMSDQIGFDELTEEEQKND